jgi:hypothetical protein
MIPDNLKTAFDKILKEVIVPFSKDLSFKRRTQHFARQADDLTQCFNVQKSQWNSYHDSLSFTFNIGFYNRYIRTISREELTIPDFPKTTDCFMSTRLGILSHKRDHWYKLSERNDSTQVAEQVESDLRKHLKPLFDHYHSLDDLKELANANTGFILLPYEQIVFLMETGQTEKGKQFIREQYQVALTPQATTHTNNYPDGRSEVKTSKPYVNQHYIDSILRLAKHYDVEL